MSKLQAPGFSPVKGTADEPRAASAASPAPKAVETASTKSNVANTGLKPGANENAFDARLLESFIQRGFQLAVGRDPTRRERSIARDFIQRQQENFTALRTRLTFHPDVPMSLSVEYMNKLRTEHFLIGPASGWDYQRGRWSGAYESIRTVERDRGPFALSTAANISNGVIEARMFLHTASESAGLLFRASVKENEARGYEVVLDPREQRIALRRHAGELTTLARAPAGIPNACSLSLKIQAAGARIRVWLGDGSKPVIDFTDPNPHPASGQVGARTWGAAMSVDDLVLHPDGAASVTVRGPQLAPPDRRAREAFCLLLLNLNEVVYVD
jgi:hypothetical protein